MSEKKYALLIASSEYDDPYFRRLEAPAQDVDAISRVLRDPAMGAFSDVKILLNEPRDKASLSIEQFFANRNTEDLLLLYFSGHGIKDEEGRLYVATKNTQHNFLVSTALPAYQVNDLIRGSLSRRKILVLDCCYSGAFSKAYLAKGEATVGVMEEFKQGQGQGRGLVTLTASDAFQYSFEGDAVKTGGAYSVFTRALVEGIETGKADEDGDQLISLDELYLYAYERVRSENPHQSPHKSGDVEGDIIVARNPQPPRPAELSSEIQEAMKSVFPGARLDAVDELGRLLHGRNKGLALAAREALGKLTEDDSLKVRGAAQKYIAAFDEACRPEEEEASQLKAEQEHVAGEKAEADRRAAETAEGRLAREQAGRQEPASESAEQKPFAQEKVETERLAERAESGHSAPEQVKRESIDKESAGWAQGKVEAERHLRELADDQETGARRGLADLIGARGPSVDWRRVFVFLVANSIAPLVVLAFGGSSIRQMFWVGLDSLIFTGCTLGGFRWIRNWFWAVALATVANGLLNGVCYVVYWSP